VRSTQGIGATNPNAFVFAQGYWWGVSAQGPFRTDGFHVELLVGPKQRAWWGINNTATAWCAHHPTRQAVLFGLHPSEAATGRSTTYPWTVWVWDLTRDVWQPERKFGMDIFHASALTTTTAQGPTAAPSGGTTSSETTSGYTASWTNGDATAQTEFWEQDPDTGTWSLVTVIAAATATYARTGRTNHKTHKWRVRHRKNGVTTTWNSTTGITAQTLISAPGLAAAQMGASADIEITLTQNADGTDIIVEKQTDGGGYSTWNTYTSKPSGTFVVYDLTSACGSVIDYRAKSYDSAWPTTDSAYATDQVDLTVDCSGGDA